MAGNRPCSSTRYKRPSWWLWWPCTVTAVQSDVTSLPRDPLLAGFSLVSAGLPAISEVLPRHRVDWRRLSWRLTFGGVLGVPCRGLLLLVLELLSWRVRLEWREARLELGEA